MIQASRTKLSHTCTHTNGGRQALVFSPSIDKWSNGGSLNLFTYLVLASVTAAFTVPL